MLGGNLGSHLYGDVSVMKHNLNMPIQYTRICFNCKNENFQLDNIVVFLIFAQKKIVGTR